MILQIIIYYGNRQIVSIRKCLGGMPLSPHLQILPFVLPKNMVKGGNNLFFSQECSWAYHVFMFFMDKL
jgi:hypothetical protein